MILISAQKKPIAKKQNRQLSRQLDKLNDDVDQNAHDLEYIHHTEQDIDEIAHSKHPWVVQGKSLLDTYCKLHTGSVSEAKTKTDSFNQTLNHIECQLDETVKYLEKESKIEQKIKPKYNSVEPDVPIYQYFIKPTDLAGAELDLKDKLNRRLTKQAIDDIDKIAGANVVSELENKTNVSFTKTDKKLFQHYNIDNTKKLTEFLSTTTINKIHQPTFTQQNNTDNIPKNLQSTVDLTFPYHYAPFRTEKNVNVASFDTNHPNSANFFHCNSTPNQFHQPISSYEFVNGMSEPQPSFNRKFSQTRIFPGKKASECTMDSLTPTTYKRHFFPIQYLPSQPSVCSYNSS